MTGQNAGTDCEAKSAPISGWRSIIVVPLTTSTAQAGRGPSAILLPRGAAGLKKESVVLCHQVTTLPGKSGKIEFLFTELYGAKKIK